MFIECESPILYGSNCGYETYFSVRVMSLEVRLCRPRSCRVYELLFDKNVSGENHSIMEIDLGEQTISILEHRTIILF